MRRLSRLQVAAIQVGLPIGDAGRPRHVLVRTRGLSERCIGMANVSRLPECNEISARRHWSDAPGFGGAAGRGPVRRVTGAVISVCGRAGQGSAVAGPVRASRPLVALAIYDAPPSGAEQGIG